MFKEKLRIIKGRLKWWTKVIFGKFKLEVDEGVRGINEGDDLLENNLASDLEDIMVKRRDVMFSIGLMIGIRITGFFIVS